MNIYKGHLTTLLLIEITEIEIDTAFSFLLIPYQALQCFMKFAIDSEGIALDAEIAVDGQRFEVRAQRSVGTSCNRDVLTAEHLRVALRGPGLRLDESIMRIAREELVDGALLVELQNALITLARLHLAVAVQNGLNVTAQVCVGVPNIFIVLFHYINRFGKTSVSREGPSAQPGK